MRRRLSKATEKFNRRTTPAHRKLLLDLATVGFLLFLMGCFWFSVGRWIALGALFMLLPQTFTDLARVLDIELIRDRFGMQQTRGRHADPDSRRHPRLKNTGTHPRPGARNRA